MQNYGGRSLLGTLLRKVSYVLRTVQRVQELCPVPAVQDGTVDGVRVRYQLYPVRANSGREGRSGRGEGRKQVHLLRREQLPVRVHLQRQRREGDRQGPRETGLSGEGVHAGYRTGRHCRRRSDWIGRTTALEAVDYDSRSTGVCPIREGTNDGQVGYGTFESPNPLKIPKL